MAVVAHGRIVIWEGASLWIFEAEHDTAETAAHSHHAIQVTISLEGNFQLRTATTTVDGPVAAVAADAAHVFDAWGLAAFLFVEPESALGKSLTHQWFCNEPIRALDRHPFPQLMDALHEAFRTGRDDAELIALGKAMIAELGGNTRPSQVDSRVSSLIDFVTANLEDQSAIRLAADHVNLSKSRASHLFVEQTGMPLKSYVLWRRLSRAVELYAGGASLTESAHAAGFSDSAHLSRTFRRMFGLPAASLRLTRPA